MSRYCAVHGKTGMTMTELQIAAKRMEGRRAFVTGGGSGIGLECARLLVRDGASVVLMGRTQERLDEGRASLAADLAEGAQVVTCAGDAAVEDDVAVAVAAATSSGSSLDTSSTARPRTPSRRPNPAARRPRPCW